MQRPIIIIGMHRSGTSLVSRMLEGLGVFMGWRREINDEARSFLSLNQWMLVQAGAAWDQPEPLRQLLSDPDSRAAAARFCRSALRGSAGFSYLGPLDWLRLRSPEKLRKPWGWKDPRTTLTVPVWRELWPEARVVHVLRNGLDVANSLKRRHARTFERARERIGERRWRWHASRRLMDAARFKTIDGGLGLWEYYVKEARRAMEAQPAGGIEVRYEELLRHPASELERLACWLELKAGPEKTDAFCRSVNPARAEAWRNDPELRKEASRFGGLLGAYGYSID